MGRIRTITGKPGYKSIAALGIAAALALAVPAFPAQAACDIGKAPAVPVVKGLAYLQARKEILGGGWQPVTGHPHNDMSSNEETFRDKGFTELQYCRLTADSPCRFKFQAGDVALWITTGGDENPLIDSAATVRSATLTCLGDPAPN